MNFAKLINKIQNMSNDSTRNEYLQDLLEVIDRGVIDGETFKTIMSTYNFDSHRNDALNILIQNSERLTSAIVYGIAWMYNNDSYRCDALKIIMRKCDSIMNSVSVNILGLFKNDSYRADATKIIINQIINIDEDTIYRLIELYQNDSYRRDAMKTISTSDIMTEIHISIKTPERYLGLFHNDSYRSECFESVAAYIDNTNPTLLYNCLNTFTNDSYKSSCVKSWASVAQCNINSNILELFQNDSYRLKALKALISRIDLSDGVTHNYIVSLFSNGAYAVSALKILKPFKIYDPNDAYTLLEFISGDKYMFKALEIIVKQQDDIYRGQSIGELLALLSRFKDCETISKVVKFIGDRFEKDKTEKIICERLAKLIDGQNAYRESCDALGLDKKIYEPYAEDIMSELPKDKKQSSSLPKDTKQSSHVVEKHYSDGRSVKIEYVGDLVKKTVTSPNGSISITITPK